MAAGLGFKTFTTGEVLTAADTNGYLMQGVLVFASAAARDAAITSPQEGQCCYLKDTDAVQTYSGSAWVGFDDSNAIQNSIVDAKGDIVAASGSDTPARLAVGSNGDTLVADSATATGLAYREDYAAGKNKIINGDFRVAQRGTSIVCVTGVDTPTLDRWFTNRNGTGTVTVSQQTFTPGTAPVAGYEGANFIRFDQSVAGSGASFSVFSTKIEDVRTFAGQTMTFSFWAKTAAAKTYSCTVRQNFGSGGSGSVDTNTSNFTTSSSWTRFSFTVAVPSISGKTIGTSSYLQIWFNMGLNETTTFDVWGTQAEDGSVATAFQTATGTIQGELAACQRYYWRALASATYPNALFAPSGFTSSTTAFVANVQFPVEMRTQPTTLDFSTLRIQDSAAAVFAASSLAVTDQSTTFMMGFTGVVAGATAGRWCKVIGNNSASAYLGFGAEL